MRIKAGLYRSLLLGLGFVLFCLSLLAASLFSLQLFGVGPTLVLLAAFCLYSWAIPRPAPPRATRDRTWGYASAMTYGLPSSPFQSLKDHQRAVSRVFRLGHLSEEEIVGKTGYSRRFVDAVLSYLDDGRDGGGAGVGARLRPRGPGPLTAVE